MRRARPAARPAALLPGCSAARQGREAEMEFAASGGGGKAHPKRLRQDMAWLWRRRASSRVYQSCRCKAHLTPLIKLTIKNADVR